MYYVKLQDAVISGLTTLLHHDINEHPTLLLMHLLIFAEHVLLGVMVDLEEHGLPPATTADVGARDLGIGITFGIKKQ